MATAIGEFGGIGMMVQGHLWAGTNGGYMNIDTPQELIDTYAEFTQTLKKFRDENGLSAAVYTQITDVETELNGLLTYDRIPKMDIGQIAKANHFELLPPTYTAVVPTSENESQTWRYTTERPGNNWNKVGFDDGSWKEGPGGFGTRMTPGIGKLGTEWRTPAIWMRRSVEIPSVPPDQLSKLLVRCYHDEDVEVFINGVKAFEANGFAARYMTSPVSPEALKAINPGAKNTIAVHCRQNTGGQYIDVGLVVRDPQK